MKRFKDGCDFIFWHYRSSFTSSAMAMILFTCFDHVLIQSMPVTSFPPGVEQPDIWGLGLGLVLLT